MRRRVETLLIIGLGGFVGANLRYLVSVWAVEHMGTSFPYGTLIVNLAWSWLRAVFTAWAAQRIELDPRVRFLIAVGFFGAFTTFSTYANESIGLTLAGNWTTALIKVLGTNALCLVGAALGVFVGGRL